MSKLVSVGFCRILLLRLRQASDTSLMSGLLRLLKGRLSKLGTLIGKIRNQPAIAPAQPALMAVGRFVGVAPHILTTFTAEAARTQVVLAAILLSERVLMDVTWLPWNRRRLDPTPNGAH